MIVSASEIRSFPQKINALAKGDPFACRILSLYHSYRPGLAFVDYWMTADVLGACTGAIARNGSNFILFLTSKSDLEEISSFLRVSGASGILCDGGFDLDTGGTVTTGMVMKTSRKIPIEENGAEVIKPNIREAYDLISLCADRFFSPPDFEEFYVDVNHKLRHGSLRICGLKDSDKLAAIAMTVAESGSGAVLGAVACHPDYRRRGFGTLVVAHLTNQLVAEGKTVFIHRARGANAAFYVKLGFTDYGYWKEYRR